MTPSTGPITAAGTGAASRVIQGFFPCAGPKILQASPAAAAPVRSQVPAAVQARPVSSIPSLPGRPATGALQPALRPGQPPRPILPAPVRPGAVQPATMLRPQVPQPISRQAPHPATVQPFAGPKPQPPQPIPPQASRSSAIQPQAGNAFALPANFNLKPRGSGQPLPEPIQKKMESFFKTSFADVRVHVGHEASAIGALAFTHGTDLYFAPGQYNPQSTQGQRLLGHELTHVVQQRAGRVRNPLGSGIAVVQEPGLEAEAERMGMRASLNTAPSNPGTLQAKVATKQHQRTETSTGRPDSLMRGIETRVVQLFSAPPPAPPIAGVRGRHLNGDGVPDESHVTTRHGLPNNLVGSVPGVIINGWPYVQGVNATGAWVRFHLVNQQIGGLGNQDNLVPTSQATNHNPNWRNFERTCLHHIAQQTSIHVTVDVQYPAINALAAVGTVLANQHFYPNQISAQCHLWNPVTHTYVLNANGAPANQRTFHVQIAPFPLLPPANANRTDLRQVTQGWLQNTLMGGTINVREAASFRLALHNGAEIDDYLAHSNEATPETRLLDAMETFADTDLGSTLPLQTQVHILNGTYHI